jgi:UDP-2,3-diacylglucosamine pyrophosphatase LpxH
MKLEGIRKIFVLGDLHLGVRNNSMEWSEIQSQFLLDTFLNDVDRDGFDPEQDILVQVGDWNHVRESTNVRIYKNSLDIAAKFSQKFKRGVYVILGNHDVYYKDRNDVHSLEGFDKMFPNFHIFTHAEELTINSHRFLMLPWVESVDRIKEIVKSHSRCKYIFCHADVKGFSLNLHTRLEHGLDFGDLANFKRVYSGHIHIRQQRNNVLYVGTPYEMDRGDRGNIKGFYVLSVGSDRVEEKFIQNQVSPRHIKIEMIDLLSLNYEEITKLFKNNFVDLLIESSFSARFPVAAFTELLKDCGHRRLEFFSYSREEQLAKSEIEINSNYEYNIFTIAQEKLKDKNLSPTLHSQIFEKFKELYDSLKNTKSYDQ